MLEDFHQKLFGKFESARMVTVNLMYAIEEEEKRRRLSAAGM